MVRCYSATLVMFLFCSILEQNGSKFLTEPEPKQGAVAVRCGAKMFVAGILNLNQQILGFMAQFVWGSGQVVRPIC